MKVSSPSVCFECNIHSRIGAGTEQAQYKVTSIMEVYGLAFENSVELQQQQALKDGINDVLGNVDSSSSIVLSDAAILVSRRLKGFHVSNSRARGTSEQVSFSVLFESIPSVAVGLSLVEELRC